MTRSLLVVHPSAELYGADRMLLEAVCGLLADGWHCVVLLPVDGPLVEPLRETGAEVVVQPFPVLRKAYLSPGGLLRYAREQLGALPAARRLLARVDPELVYVSTLTAPQWLALGRWRRRPVLCHVHEAEDAVPALVRAALVAPLLLASGVLANSAASRDVLTAQFGRLAARTEVLYNGVVGPPQVVPARPVPSAPVRLVLVGRLSARKGSDVAVEAVRLLAGQGCDVALELVGGVFPGYEWFEQGLRDRIGEAGLQDRVRLCGEQPEPWPAMARADVVLVPSRVEPFGNTAVEAMLAGRPVVAARTQGLREVVDAGRTGEHAEPGDARSLADAVLRVLADWPASLRRADLARAEAVERFSPGRYRRQVAAAARALAPHP